MQVITKKLNVKISDMESTGASSSVVLTSIDVQLVLGSCDANPLIMSYLYAKYQLGDTQASLNHFNKLLKPFMYNRLISSKRSIDTKTLLKYHTSIINALDDVTDCVFKYLTRNKLSDYSVRKYMVDTVKKDTFRRRYMDFLQSVIIELENDLNKLLYQICKKLQKI